MLSWIFSICLSDYVQHFFTLLYAQGGWTQWMTSPQLLSLLSACWILLLGSQGSQSKRKEGTRLVPFPPGKWFGNGCLPHPRGHIPCPVALHSAADLTGFSSSRTPFPLFACLSLTSGSCHTVFCLHPFLPHCLCWFPLNPPMTL